MTWLVMIFLLVIGALVQLLGPASSLLGNTKLPVLISLTLYYALNRETETMLAAALLGGVIQDILSPIPLGYSSLCFIVVGWIAAQFRNVVHTDSLMPSLLFGMAGSCAATVMIGIMLAKGGLIVPAVLWMTVRIVGATILGALCAPCVFFLAGRLDHMVGNVTRKEDPLLNEIE